MVSPSTSRLVRGAKLLSLPGAALGDAAAGRIRRLRGEDPAAVGRDLRARNARRTRHVLGDLKGGALKAGQLLSTVESLFPADPDATWRSTLTSLQESSPTVPFAELEPVLAAMMGPGWRSRFRDLDTGRAAAASIGQVHRGVWEDGRDVAVKIQYPGIADAVTADVGMLSWSLRAAALVARGVAMPPLVSELRTRLAEELDYVHEGRVQTAFADAYEDDPEVVVPRVVLASPRVLVTDWLDATPLAQVAMTADQRVRDLAGARYQRFLLSGPSRCGWLHTDPHPGNFRVLQDERLGVLDFGSALSMPGGLPPTFGRLIAVLSGDVTDQAEVLRRLRAHGLLRPGRTLDVRALVDYLSPFSEPAAHERFCYSRRWLAEQFGRVNDPRNPDFAVALRLNLPAEHLFTHRVWLGIVGVLSQLAACVPVRPELHRYLPGFDAEPAP